MSVEDRKLVARMKEIRELIAEFGLILGGYDPGITASLKGKPEPRGRGYLGEAISFDGKEWAWLEPLLQELKVRRKMQVPDVGRLITWLTNPKRKGANAAFTDGQEREIAYWMEMAMTQSMNDMKKAGK